MPSLPDHPGSYTMSFGDHLDELRRRFLLALALPLPTFIVLFFFSDTLIGWIVLPVHKVLRHHNLPADLQVLSPPEVILTQLKLALIAAIVVCAPWILYQAWRFIAPGLYMRERRFVYFLIPGSAVLTVAGVLLLYYVMLPLMLHVLIMFGTDIKIGPGLDEATLRALAEAKEIRIVSVQPEDPAPGEAWLLVPQLHMYVALAPEKPAAEDEPGTDPAPEQPAAEGDSGAVRIVFVPRSIRGGIDQVFRLSFVINFTLVLLLGVAIAFQMPLVVLLLGWLNLASAPWLRAQRKYALIVCGVLSAMLTPADAASMLVMLVPLYGLYELGILLLVIAPASAIAEGRIAGVRFARPSRPGRGTDKAGGDKTASSAGRPTEPTQSDVDAQQPDWRQQSPYDDADDEDES